MLKALKTILTLTIIISCNTFVSGQELRALAKNHVIGEALEMKQYEKQQMSVGHDTIHIPFFDDFSDYGPLPLANPFPRSDRWSDKYAFINSEYADSMISFGVATLDAFDQFGNPYSVKETNKGYSDTLTSNYFVLGESDTNNLYLSFFYQAGGKGDKPEKDDSLCVDFFSAKGNLWVNSWQIEGGTEMHSFKQVNIKVPDTLITDSLRFRFRNRTSIKNDNEDKQSNADQWHLDYIQLLRTGQPDTLANLNDVAIMSPLLSSLSECTSIPYRHFSMISEIKRRNNPVMLRTFFPQRYDEDMIRIERTHIAFDLIKNEQTNMVGEDGGIANEMSPIETSVFQDIFDTRYSETAGNKSGKFEIKTFINVSGINQRMVNDTIRRREFFSDYYAYDDGSAEFGFGISGEKQGQVSVANRFRILRKSSNPDTLKAVYIMFNQTTNDTAHSEIEFKICVWKNNGIKPGELLYESDSNYIPDTTQSKINQFARIELETPLLVSDTIFVGIKQESTDFINIGYDINNNSLSNLYLKTSLNNWYSPSSFLKGSIMIRPAFGEQDMTVAVPEPIKMAEVSLYPNPTSGQLHFTLPGELENKQLHIKIYDILGSVVLDSFTDNNSIDVSSLNTGIYMAVLCTQDGLYYPAVKFIKK